ncbi:glutamine--tRNA ligase/YqeY domain fusion protein [Sediminitomix flava]|uniref:Glutamine--tRNA ligase n=1 Tax=Sediminitomix flava TaxID=379075 RepID=A0A316A095_SEDFL|nr:glutamine--tRNA ligase/YqeY domain fusion protein [Sediminitomix flava]PWJ43067.1 glutaminyl-tRNA synthetase [Sediminitomix flava]
MSHNETNHSAEENNSSLNFIESIIEDELKEGKHGGVVHTRFPPEPNGYLHIGHAKSICLNFGLAQKYQAKCNLRFDDTNPSKEEQEYVDAIKEDVKWLGFQWDGDVKYTSDYFDQLYTWAVKLIKDGKAYVDEQSAEVIASQKGTPTVAGTASPFRDRPVEENLAMFEKMKNGELPEGAAVLRAKIDMASPNMHMRDPLMYRIINKSHHRTGDKWHIYPMYDYAHGQSDYIEGITNSICTLEFEVHRPLYEWFLEQIYDGGIKPSQREFARLNLSYTVMSKRKLMQLVEIGAVSGWDDPRMPTISGLRRRGYTPESIRNFAKTIGVGRRENVIDVALLEFSVREHLNKVADRVMAVLDPVKLVIDNYPEGEEEWLDAENNPEDENSGSRKVPFSKVLYIEREDFKEEANRKFFRLTLGKEVRLKNAYIIKGESVVKDADGNITEIHCTYDADSRSGSGTEASQRKVKGTLHWVSAAHALDAEVRLYDRLFNDEAPDGHKEKDFKDFLNPDSLTVISNAKIEPSLAEVKPLDSFQFQRMGYFNVDKDSTAEKLIFNRTVGLRDSWAKKK